MNDELMRDLVKACGLDWHKGYMPLFEGDPTNRYAVLIEAALSSQPKPAPVRLLDREVRLICIDWLYSETRGRTTYDLVRLAEFAVLRKNGMA